MVAQDAVRFLLAARNGDLSVLQSEKLTESLQDDHGANSLHYAARGGSVEVLKYLVSSRGFKPIRRSKVGATALHDAAATGNLACLRWLLEQADAKVDDQDGTGATVTHLSARYGHAQTVEWLLDQTNCDVLKKSATGAVALHFAAEGGHLECVKLLIAESPRSVNMQMNNGSTPAYLACQRGHLMTAEYLASKNGTPKIHTFDGMSPLHAAAQMGHLHIMKWLIKDQGLNPNERDFDGATPLHYAASRGHEECLDWLLREGGARIILDNLGGSPLHSAAEFGNNQIVKSLLSGGCDGNITDNEGLTAQELADKCGHQTTAAILRGEATEADQAPTLAVPQPSKVRPPSPRNPPPPRRRSSALVRTTSSQSGVTSTTTTTALTGDSATRRAPPPAPAPKPPTPVPLRATSAGSPSAETVVAPAWGDSLENLPGSAREEGVFDRSMSAASVASSASSFGYFSPHGGGKIEVVEVDVHAAPSRVCVFSSQETGEREVAPPSGKCSSSKVSDEFSKAAASATFYISSSASASSPLPPVKSSYLPSYSNIRSERNPDLSDASAQDRQQRVSTVHTSSGSNSNSNNSQEAGESGGRSSGEVAGSKEREHSPSVRERKALLAAAAAQNKASSPRPELTPRMEKSQGLSGNAGSTNSNSSSGSLGSARSVISISSKNVTIISTGTDGSKSSPKVSTTPLRKDPTDRDMVASQAPVSSRRRDSDFISALSQKFQGGGPMPPPAGHKGSNLPLNPQAQQQQLQKRQQVPNAAAPAPPPPGPSVNGHVEMPSASQMNGHMSDAGPPPPPPPPPPLSGSEQTAFRKADASYAPRSRTYNSVNGTIPGTPTGDPNILQQKTDLMSALSELVKSGSPSASLRKTTGPGKGGVKDVFAARKGTVVNGSAKEPMPTIMEFDPKNFLDQVDDTDSAGNRIPDWKRHLKAKNLAQKAEQEYLERKKVEDYEARFKGMPAWKRALIEKKEAAGKAQQ